MKNLWHQILCLFDDAEKEKQKWKQKHYITDCATILKISFYPLLYQPKCRSNITTVTRWYNFYKYNLLWHCHTILWHVITCCDNMSHLWQKYYVTTSNTRENSSILKMTNVCTSNVTRCDTAVTIKKSSTTVSQICDEIWMLVFSTTCEWLWKKLIFLEMMLNFLSRNYDTYVCH